MKPPFCYVCGGPAYHVDGGNLVRFADYMPLPDGMVGHPRGLEWFCKAHLGEAKKLQGKTMEEAASVLNQKVGSAGS